MNFRVGVFIGGNLLWRRRWLFSSGLGFGGVTLVRGLGGCGFFSALANFSEETIAAFGEHLEF